MEESNTVAESQVFFAIVSVDDGDVKGRYFRSVQTEGSSVSMAINGISLWVSIGFIILMAFVGIWDMVAIFSQGRVTTVTENIQAWSKEFPVLPFIFGAIIGHLFWPGK